MKAVDFNKLESAPLDSIGYSAASQGDTLDVLASELLRRNPSGEFSDESKAELEKGMTGRKNELYGTRYFVHKGGEYTPIKNPKQVTEADGLFALTIEFACGLSAYDFGQLKTKDNARYELVKAARNDESKYRSNRMKSLMKAVSDLKAGIKGRTRGENKTMLETVNAAAETLVKRNKVAQGKGDPTAAPNKAELKRMINEAIDKM
jgi:hypothetical protein